MNIEEVTACPENQQWMEAEIESLKENDVWELVELPKGRKTVGSKWVFKVNTRADGSVECYKARLVGQGFMQKYGTYYDKTCPVVRMESLRTLIALSVKYNLIAAGIKPWTIN